MAMSEVPLLQEVDLFQPKIKPRNALRMAADWLVTEYKAGRGGELSTSDHFIPAYAAHVLWTLAGNRMATNIPATPEFSRPEQVFRRAEERGQDNPDRVRNLIARIVRSSTAPIAVTYWARQWVERNSPTARWRNSIGPECPDSAPASRSQQHES
jgi:hypothetical protein